MTVELTQDQIQQIISAVLAALGTNTKYINQLSPATELRQTDMFELDGGRYVQFADLTHALLTGELDSKENSKAPVASVVYQWLLMIGDEIGLKNLTPSGGNAILEIIKALKMWTGMPSEDPGDWNGRDLMGTIGTKFDELIPTVTLDNYKSYFQLNFSDITDKDGKKIFRMTHGTASLGLLLASVDAAKNSIGLTVYTLVSAGYMNSESSGTEPRRDGRVNILSTLLQRSGSTYTWTKWKDNREDLVQEINDNPDAAPSSNAVKKALEELTETVTESLTETKNNVDDTLAKELGSKMDILGSVTRTELQNWIEENFADITRANGGWLEIKGTGYCLLTTFSSVLIKAIVFTQYPLDTEQPGLVFETTAKEMDMYVTFVNYLSNEYTWSKCENFGGKRFKGTPKEFAGEIFADYLATPKSVREYLRNITVDEMSDSKDTLPSSKAMADAVYPRMYLNANELFSDATPNDLSGTASRLVDNPLFKTAFGEREGLVVDFIGYNGREVWQYVGGTFIDPASWTRRIWMSEEERAQIVHSTPIRVASEEEMEKRIKEGDIVKGQLYYTPEED